MVAFPSFVMFLVLSLLSEVSGLHRPGRETTQVVMSNLIRKHQEAKSYRGSLPAELAKNSAADAAVDSDTGVSRGGAAAAVAKRNNKKPEIDPEDKIRKSVISWYADLIWTAANLLFLYVWIALKGEYFSKTFMEQGFCNKNPDVLPWQTQFDCFRFDLISAAAITLVGFKKNFPPSKESMAAWGNAVLYPIAHGSAHLAIFKGIIKPDKPMDKLSEKIALGVILAMGPVGVYLNIQEAKAMDPLPAALLCIALELAMVKVFVKYFTYGVLALLYINVSINLVLMASRLILFPKKAVKARNAIFGPMVYPMLAAISLVVLVMWIEPTQCDQWFAQAGGHIWFDVSLIIMGLVGFLNAIKQSEKPHPIPRASFY